MINPLHHLVRWLAPYDCLGCNTEGRLLCHWCRSDMPHVSAACYYCKVASPSNATCAGCQSANRLMAVTCRTYYESPIIKKIIWHLKFDRSQDAATEMAEMIAPLLHAAVEQTIVTHIPTVAVRIRQRGYDQAALIARHTARLAGLRYAPVLYRRGASDQIGASRLARRTQAANSFLIKNPSAVKNKRFILIDDVMTTGATIEAAAATLLKAGAQDVQAAVFAYTPAEAGQAPLEML